jgi:transcriptional regulator with XRE-family HTH domain
MTRGLTLSALAEQAGVAKSTVSLIERGQGNPSIDTVWALARALGVPFASLFHDEAPSDDVSVVREGDAPVVAVGKAGEEGEGFIVRHLLTRTGGDLIEIYISVLDDDTVRHTAAHVSGLFQHVAVATGTVEVSGESFSEVISQGDLISFRADRPHSYRVIAGPVRLVSVHEYPRRNGP